MRKLYNFLLLLMPFWTAAIEVAIDHPLFLFDEMKDIESYRKILAARCDTIMWQVDAEFDLCAPVKLYNIDLLLCDASQWSDELMAHQELFLEDIKTIDPDVNWMDYINFKRLVRSHAFNLGIFSLQQCGCMTTKIMPTNCSLRDQVNFSVLATVADVPHAQTLCITDVGSGYLLPLLRLLDSLVKRGYKKFVVNAIDLNYERLIADYKKLYTSDGQGVYHITPDFKPIFSEDECKNIVEIFKRLFAGELEKGVADSLRFNLDNYAYRYQMSSALIALLSWARCEHIDISFNLYATVAEYLEDFDRKKFPHNDIITAVDVGIVQGSTLLKEFDELRLKTLKPHGLEILLAHTDMHKSDDAADLFGFNVSVPLKTKFTQLAHYFCGTKNKFEDQEAACSEPIADDDLASSEESPVLFAFGGNKPENLSAAMVDSESGYVYWQ